MVKCHTLTAGSALQMFLEHVKHQSGNVNEIGIKVINK